MASFYKQFRLSELTPDENALLFGQLVKSSKNGQALQSRSKKVWDASISLFVGYSLITTFYELSFGDLQMLKPFTLFVEICFFLDILLSFLTFQKQKQKPFTDQAYEQAIAYIKQRPIFYIKSLFIFDLIAILPLFLLIFGSQVLWFKLTRLGRFKRFLRLIDEQSAMKIVENVWYIVQSKNNIHSQSLYALRQLYKIFRLLVIVLLLAYFICCLFRILSQSQAKISPQQHNFYDVYALQNETGWRKLTVTFYFIITTLTTVGYGDYQPKTHSEKIYVIGVMILGVAFFAYILSSFNSILEEYGSTKQGEVSNIEVQKWMNSLQRFSKTPIPLQLQHAIDKHYSFHFANSRLSGMTVDDQYLQCLPKRLRQQIVKHLFVDIYAYFRRFFLLSKFPKSNFHYELPFILQPVHFKSGSVIQTPNQDVFEILLFMTGEVELSLQFNEQICIKRYFHHDVQVLVLGNYNALFNVKTFFGCRTITDTKAYLISKFKLNALLKRYPRMHQAFKEYAQMHMSQMLRWFANQLPSLWATQQQQSLPDKSSLLTSEQADEMVFQCVEGMIAKQQQEHQQTEQNQQNQLNPSDNELKEMETNATAIQETIDLLKDNLDKAKALQCGLIADLKDGISKLKLQCSSNADTNN